MFKRFGDGQKSLRPIRNYRKNMKKEKEKMFEASHGGELTQLEKSVKVPVGANGIPEIDPMEWFAIHVVEFYNILSILTGIIEEDLKKDEGKMRCNEFEYLWRDPSSTDKDIKPAVVTPLQYINNTFDWIDKLVEDPKIFPDGNVFPKNFKKVVKSLFKYMFRIYTYLYFNQIGALEKTEPEEKHHQLLSNTLKHFLCFTFEFHLLKKRELIPMNEWVIQTLGEKYKKKLDLKK